MSRAFAKIVKVDVAQDRYDRDYWGAEIKLMEPAHGTAFVPLDERLWTGFPKGFDHPKFFRGKTAIIENYGPGAPILFIVGIWTETPASLIEKLTGEAKAAVELSKPDAQKSDLEVVKAMLTRAGIVFSERGVNADDVRLDVVDGDWTTWMYFVGKDRDLNAVFGGKTG